MKAFLPIALLMLMFESSNEFSFKTDTTCLEQSEINMIMGAWAFSEKLQEGLTFYREYSWGRGPQIANGTIIIDYMPGDADALYYQDGGLYIFIKPIEKYSDNEYGLKMLRNKELDSRGFEPQGIVYLHILAENRMCFDFSEYPIAEFGDDTCLYKISGP